ncbi:Respiratory-chain NADH dehydrogenase domain 51 kDa subunit [Haloterrigena salina JCM 13891]|uniref:Respiratory-chain NADH dehydrogenase domain 51 kDa subunit n=1 Tax=Haloterrigena salina JCM 13891 TaxID=1227488 RepID=M0BWJ5_9EURY|nr:NADH-ubiquinone oxidoreductase-F iron-sulfur binding region domain-containing protein [Haloterrigena salina]ELZ14477.1 Respiratory-chain NADH dehydrogenase domain 51 kDa subunit [Haloterrigena salina JCM 13891]
MTDTRAVERSTVLRVATDPTADRETAYETARSTADAVPVVRTGPTGIDAVEPLVLATVDGRTAFHPDPDRSTVADVVAALEDGDLLPDDATAVVEHDPETRSLPAPERGPLSVGRRDVLGPCGWVNPLVPEDYDLVSTDRDAGGVADAGLLGRGRGDAAANEDVGETWATVRETDGDPIVVVNANDADDRQRVDRTLLAAAPIAVLDGLASIAEHVGAEDAVLFVDETDPDLHRHLTAAIDAAADVLPVVPQLVAGPDEYRAGAPTAALEALEGNDRIEPRRQPPSPAVHGLYGRPTAIHSVRTVLQVRRLLTDETDGASTADETGRDPGTRLFTVTGDVASPATVELGPEDALGAAREAVDLEGSFKMACVGGVLGGLTESLDVPATADALTAADLGTEGAIELLNDQRCAVATAGERARFAAAENSGRCVPGREGTKQLTELLRAVYDDSLESDAIRELGRVMSRTSNCRIGARAPRPVLTAMDAFEPEFRAHTDGRCPSGTCTENL